MDTTGNGRALWARGRRAFRVGLRTAMAASAVVLMNAAASPAFVTFESGQVRPLALSPDGTRLFAVNTPDASLEIFDVAAGGLSHAASVPVGLEPVAVAARDDDEVWVVNHLSDSVSIVDVSETQAARVVRTLLVGDEPRDIVFAGAARDRAFITTAHRGQNTPLHADIDDILQTEGLGRADVWVFDASDLGAALGGTPLTRVTLFSDTPRALAVSPDGGTVYAAAFHSGNRTMTLNAALIADGCGATGLPPPCTDHLGVPQPEAGLIVRYDGSAWRDELGRDWSAVVRFSLPDYDVFAIDADADPPVALTGPGAVFPHVGTVLFNMTVNPISGAVYVSNTEAFNDVRFEGPGIFGASFGASTVRGHLVESRITVLDGTGSVTPVHLNKHIDYDECCDAVPNDVGERSLAFPLEMAVTSDGQTLYVAALGSSKIGVFDTAALENDTFVPSSDDHIEVTGGGPTGIVLDEARGRAYVLTRFDNSVSVLNTVTQVESGHVPLHNPEPEAVVEGRRFLYDARLSSSHGDQACASCHIFGDFDSLAWDLGNPDDTTLNNPGPFIPPFQLAQFGDPDFKALKGPMTTQSLRGMDNHGPMHWRGDRTGGNDAASTQPGRGSFSEVEAFKKFNPAFEGLLGRNEQLTDEQMAAFTSFILEVVYPPNPVRNLDSSMTVSQKAGHDFFFGPISDTLFNCNGCHVTNPAGNAQYSAVKRPGFFGSDGRTTFEGEPQFFKVAHLRNMYQKVGMFGFPSVTGGGNAFTGDQIRGFGFLHDGSVDTLFRFHSGNAFSQRPQNPTGFPVGEPGDALRHQVESFMHAFPSNYLPIVGQQITRSAASGSDVDERIDLLLARYDSPDNSDDPQDLTTPECDIIAKGRIGGAMRGFLYMGNGRWQSDDQDEDSLADAALRALAESDGHEITFTAVPPEEGYRSAIDADLDGFLDFDERSGGGDPLDAESMPCTETQAFDERARAFVRDDRGQLKLIAAIALPGTYDDAPIQVTLEDSGGVIFDQYLAEDSLDANGAHTVFKYKADVGPITRLQLKADRTQPGTYRMKIQARDGWSAGAANETAATTTVRVSIGGICVAGNVTRVD